MRRLMLICAGALAVSVALSACGAGTKTLPAPSRAGKDADVVDVWVSLPLSGPQGSEGRAMVRGIRVGLKQEEDSSGEIDGFIPDLDVKNDADSHGWTAKLVERNAQRAAEDPRAVLYIGELNSGATEISLPILNQAGIVQVTPGSGYTGLTNKLVPITGDGEPNKYYPAGGWTLLRLIPDDVVQAAATLKALSSSPPSCQRVAAISVGPAPDAPALVKAVAATAKDYGMSYLSPTLTSYSAKAELAYAGDLKTDTVQCLVIAGRASAQAVSLVKAVHAVLPDDQILGTSGLCSQKFTNQRDGGIPASLDPYVSCTSPVLPLRRYARKAVKDFIAAYQVTYPHQQPGPYTAYGYVAGELATEAVEAVGLGGDNRTAVESTLAGAGEHQSALMGTLFFDSHGNLLSRQIGLFHIVNGVPSLLKVLEPTKLFGLS